jgi:hypothetical protein
LSATLLVPSHRVGLLGLAILFVVGSTSAALADEWRDLAVARNSAASMISAGDCVVCGFVSDSVGLPYSDETDRGYISGPLAYANPEDDAVTPPSSARPIQTPTPAVANINPRTSSALPSIGTLGPPALNEAPVRAKPVPKVVVVKGQRVEIVSPDEVNSIDLAADVSRLEQADVQFAPRTASGGPTLQAQALSVMAGALAGLAVGLFLIGWRSVRISWRKHYTLY